MEITAQLLNTTVRRAGLQAYVFRRCSICGDGITLEFRDDTVFCDGNCSCTPPRAPARTSCEDVARYINMQTPERRQKIWAEMFGEDIAVSASLARRGWTLTGNDLSLLSREELEARRLTLVRELHLVQRELDGTAPSTEESLTPKTDAALREFLAAGDALFESWGGDRDPE